MRNKTCPKTMTGKHVWNTMLDTTSFKMYDQMIWGDKSGIKMCRACRMIDDRKVKK